MAEDKPPKSPNPAPAAPDGEPVSPDAESVSPAPGSASAPALAATNKVDDAKPAPSKSDAPPTKDRKTPVPSRKREREGSSEPSPQVIPDAKKNRRLGESSSERSSSSPKPSLKEEDSQAPGVGQIRKKVQDLDWAEKEDAKDKPSQKEDTDIPSADSQDEQTKKDDKSELEKVAEEAPEESKDNDSKTEEKTEEKTESSAPAAPKAAPLAFASFRGSSSPFGQGASGSKSWMEKSSPAGGVAPSALGSLGKHSVSSPFASATKGTGNLTPGTPCTPGSISPRPQPGAKGKSTLTFGSFAVGSGFASASKSVTASPADSPKPDQEESTPEEKSAGDAKFKEMLQQQGKSKEETKTEEDDRPRLEAKAENYWTGEEDEKTVYSGGAKLWNFDPNKPAGEAPWSERGKGPIRVNVPKDLKEGEGKSGRVVMRATGVLRVILNVKLFAGIECKLGLEKDVKFSAFEDGKLVNFALRFRDPATAAAFKEAVETNAPEKSA